MKLVFRFKEELIDNKPIMRPKIPVKFSRNGKSLNVIGLLDSGSDFIVIPKEIAEYLELKYGSKTEECDGIGGSVRLRYTMANITIDNHIFHNIAIHVLSGWQRVAWRYHNRQGAAVQRIQRRIQPKLQQNNIAQDKESLI